MSIRGAELEAARRPDMLVHPLTGEMLDLASAPDDKLAGFLADIREHESMLKEVKGIVSREALRRMDRAGRWTTRAGAYELKSSSPLAEEFDGAALREALLDLVDGGVLDIELVDRAVEMVVSYKPRKDGINALRKLGGRVREVVNAYAVEVEKPRYVSVSRVAR